MALFWKQEEVGLWRVDFGKGPGDLQVMVHLQRGPSRFIATVHVLGNRVHHSEHGCLCEAKTAAEEALERHNNIQEP